MAALPTDPATLKAWAVKICRTDPVLNTELIAPSADNNMNNCVAGRLSLLLVDMPTPPRVRAAAFAALALLPAVQRLGAAPDGEHLVIDPGKMFTTLVVDPATSLVRSASVSLQSAPAKSVTIRSVTVLVAQWTDVLPTISPRAK